MVNLCPFAKYSKIFGVADEGNHKYKFLKTAIVDYTLTILGACLISFLTGFPLELMTLILLILGIILHILFGIPTHTNKFLGIKCTK